MDHTLFLIARPSFIEGIARLLDFAGTLNEYNTSLDGQQADQLATRADCLALANDALIDTTPKTRKSRRGKK